MTPTRREAAAVAALVMIFGTIYSFIGVFRHRLFGSSAFDLGIFDQAVWHWSRFEIPASTVNGFTNLLGDHFSPALVVFAPLYWIAPWAETLIVAQAVLFAASIVPVFLFLRARVSRGPALLLCGAYGLFWGLQRAAEFDVHEIAFAPLLLAVMILAVDRKSWGLLWLTAVATVMVKEDLIPVLMVIGCYLIATGERLRGVVLLASSVVTFVLIVQVLMPALDGGGAYAHASSFAAVLQRPWTFPMLLVTPPAKLYTAVMWLAPFAFLPLTSPFGWWLAPFVVIRLLSSSALHWGTTFHYAAPLAPILAMSAGDGLARFAQRIADGAVRARVVMGGAATCLALSMFLPGNQPLWDLFEPEHYRMTPMHLAGRRALSVVPPDASVVAQSAILPHLSHRLHIYELKAGAPDADIVIASTGLSPYPNESPDAITSLIDERVRQGYSVVFEDRGWIVLKRSTKDGPIPERHQQLSR